MKFKINIISDIRNYNNIIRVDFYSKSDDEHEKDGYESGIYNCCFETKTFYNLSLIENIESAVNQCLKAYENE